jgi:16S rRNA C967 or C1407 C5-methylase (RsmB/RsmF family)
MEQSGLLPGFHPR